MTEKMSREEYEQYSTARQASFVYRKSEFSPFFLPLSDPIFPEPRLIDGDYSDCSFR